jgi:hypothetical protein
VPSKSGKQHRLMALVANDPKAAKRLGIPQSVGRDYVEADKGRKFGSGGSMKESKAMMKKEVSFMKKKGAPKSMIKHEEAEYGMKKGVKKMQRGGSSTPIENMPGFSLRDPRSYNRDATIGGRRMAKGGVAGSYRRAADGIASKGKTKGKMVKMAYGGKC